MKLSKLFTKTSKEISEEEYSINAQYLLRGGFVRKEIAGVYSFLPLGLRVLNKIESIIRRHMDTVSQEILMTALQPIANREKTHRLDVVDVLMKTTGANEKSKQKSTNEYILGCTHEEIVTPLVQEFAKSYKDLPISVYQIQSKFRNEARAKSGLLRGREFRMKDAYSFHIDEADLLKYYEQMKIVYMKIFEDLGIGQDTYITAASGGDFTDGFSHEFQTICEAGEDLIFIDPSTRECYNKEVCPSQAPKTTQDVALQETKEEIHMLDVQGTLDTIYEQNNAFVSIQICETDDNEHIAIATRGDYQINGLKLNKCLGKRISKILTKEDIKNQYHISLDGKYFFNDNNGIRSLGLIDLPENITIYHDDSLKDLINFSTFKNIVNDKESIIVRNVQCINVNRDRDIPKPNQFYDFKETKLGDFNPKSGNPRECHRACEVGNIFPLNTKFSQAFDYHYIDDQGKPQIVYMGCYGIGPSRIMGVLVEKFHDKNGIIRPDAIAPYRYCIIPIGDEAQNIAQELYQKMTEKNMEVVLDDRDCGPGFKLKDADLIGYPWKIIISDKTLAHAPDTAEFVARKTGESSLTNIRQRLGQQG